MEGKYNETVSEIEDKCELCKVDSKTPSRQVVGMPMATKFNERVTLDLKQ